MWPHLVIVSTPSLAFPDRVVEAREPVLVQAFCPELSVEAFDERIVRWRAGPREVQRHALHVRPQVEVSGDELAALIDPDRGGIPASAEPTTAWRRGRLRSIQTILPGAGASYLEPAIQCSSGFGSRQPTSRVGVINSGRIDIIIMRQLAN